MQISNDNHKQTLRVLMLGAALDVKGGITSVEKLILDNAPPELQIHHVATFAQGSALYNVIVFIKSVQILLWTLLKGEADLVHIHFAERGSTLRKTILALIVLAFRQPLIFHAHGATYKEFHAGLPNLIQHLLDTLFSKSTKFIALSESWKDYYSQQFRLSEKQITVLYNPVQIPSSIPHRLGKKQLKMIFLGRIGKRGGALDLAKSVVTFPKQDKGAFNLIRAFAALPESDRNCTELILAGNGDLEAAQKLIQELNIERKITICPWLSPEQRDELLSAADAFILPSYNEGLPMSMLEAMAWGLPVIVTPVGGIPEVIHNNKNGLLVQPGNQEQLVQAMQNLIRDECLRTSLGTAARKSVECLDIKNYINSLLLLYTSVISQGNNLDSKTSIIKPNS
ncbi:glycosyltransferase [Cylindrospermum stagnale PCC 7417]|uniref:Glycosyltransferase n=1 Tax=Cylindrospermum stagnale PCC 7417 TaxID=56107 RepID=K9X2W2_9NOST|nr:glycosyltransferase family 4 protein [Cylindrospermum stagnale]AFZ26424.1 glycosyltransferase [Cylindrospermum stagnale PCC 7417]